MTREEYIVQEEILVGLASIAKDIRAERIIHEIDQAEAIGSFSIINSDGTCHGEHLENVRNLAKSIVPFIKEARKNGAVLSLLESEED